MLCNVAFGAHFVKSYCSEGATFFEPQIKRFFAFVKGNCHVFCVTPIDGQLSRSALRGFELGVI